MKDSPETYVFSFADLQIKAELLEHYMGYGDQESCPEPVSETILDAMKLGPALCKIRGGYVICDDIMVDKENKKVFSNGLWFETRKIVTHQLRRSEQAAWFVCTAGEKISDHIRKEMQDGDMIKGYVLDVLANVVVETAMDRIQEQLKEIMSRKGLMITNRYSPGYCNWDIAEQQKLFKILPENFLDITLSESSLMHPMKSVSGVIGIGKEVKFNQYTCNLCNDRNCLYRDKR